MSAIFKQNDPLWANITIIPTRLCKDFGGTVVLIAQALKLKGWTTRPLEVITALKSGGAINGTTGAIDFYKVQTAFPQMRMGQSEFSIIQGAWGMFSLPLLLFQGEYYNVFDGTTGRPDGWQPTCGIQTFSIDQA